MAQVYGNKDSAGLHGCLCAGANRRQLKIAAKTWIFARIQSMPTLTRWFVKTSFVYLALALLVGLLLAIQPIAILSGLGSLFPIYIHLLVFGWLTQLVFGVVYWMFPKYSAETPRGSETLGWWTYALLNSGLVLRAIAEPLQSAQPNPISGWVLVVSAVLQLLSGLAFVLNSWKRIRVR